MPLSDLVKEVRAALGVAEANRPDAPVELELFHAANSICSQKVRSVLAQQQRAYASREMNIGSGDTYIPSYVRLRMIGCQRLSGALASAHTGSTAVSSGGCDAAVVPTLVDWRTGEVIVDSKAICLYLDENGGDAPELRPSGLWGAIDAELATIDELPNYQLLMGRPPGGHETPVMRSGGGGPGFSLAKVERCRRYLEEFEDDPILAPAYTAKLTKELQAANELFAPDAMKSAYATVEAACQDLETRLASIDTDWLFGAFVTMADLFWGVELLRLKNLGVDRTWSDGRMPHLAKYAGRLEALPSIRQSVIDWPGALF